MKLKKICCHRYERKGTACRRCPLYGEGTFRTPPGGTASADWYNLPIPSLAAELSEVDGGKKGKKKKKKSKKKDGKKKKKKKAKRQQKDKKDKKSKKKGKKAKKKRKKAKS
ncbi:MAG: hypothetical protein SX243_14390 [Acidobacteriota bacterium]|nr:hypothetical protein [Acidobacteriota bacterium]